MFSDKLVTLLCTFGKVDLNRFRKMVASPYFNDEPDTLNLFDICHNALKKSQDSLFKLTKEQIWKKMYPGKAYDDAHLRRMASDLVQMAIKFKALEQREREPMEDWIFEQKALETSGLDKHLAGVERRITKHIETVPAHSADSFYLSFRFHWNIFNRSYRVVAATDYMAKLLPANRALESFYFNQKLKMYVAWLSYRKYRSTDKILPLPPGFWEYIDEQGYGEIPMIGVYRKVIRILTEPDDESLFEDLLRDLEMIGDKIAPEDYRECCYVAQNYCALKINRGESQYYGKAFTIFKNMVERDGLLEEGQLAEGVYKNIITTGLRAGEFKWVENFIEEYSWYLPPGIRENARAFNLANIYSHQRQYDRALEVLRNVEYSDVTYTLGSKTMLLRIYYEMSEYMALDSLIDSFRIYLRRNQQISKNLQKEYNNFLNLVKKMTTLRVGDKKALSEFKEKVMATSYNTPKKWLLDKIEEMESYQKS